MANVPSATATFLWFGTRAVDFVNGGSTGAQLEIVDEASDFATRDLSGGTFDFTGTEWRQFLAFSATQADLDAFNAANSVGIDLSNGVDTAATGAVNTTGDLRVGEGVVAHNIADISGGGRLVDVSDLLDESNDPIAITGHGRANGARLDTASMDKDDAGNRVIFSNELGFGLINGSGTDSGGTANAQRLNDGDSINIEIRHGKVLQQASFTVKVKDNASAHVVIDSDGATIRDTNGDAQGGFVQDASAGELDLGALAHGTKVTINYVNQTIWFDDSIQFLGDTAGFFAAFLDGGAKDLTLGSRVSSQVGWSVGDLVLISDVALGEPANQDPLALGVTGGTGAEDTAIAGQVIASDPDADTLAYTIAMGDGPASGSVALDAATGAFTYTPDPDFNGTDSFVVLVEDGQGGSATQLVSLTVTPVNDAPVAVASLVATNAGVAGLGQLTAFDVDAGDTLSFALETGPTRGTVAIATDGSFTYTPAADETGSDSFTFTVTDAAGASSSATVAVEIAADGAALPEGYTRLGSDLEHIPNVLLASNLQTVLWSHDIAALEGGGYVQVWSADDGSGRGVFAQRYGADGVALGAPVRANSFTSGDQQWPSVAALDGGGFVVTWSSNGQDGSGWGVYGQRYDAAGNALGAEFRANSVTSNNQQWPSVAALADGGFVVTWSSLGQDGSGWGIYGKRYDAAGNAVGGEFRANSATSSEQQFSSIATLEGGGFVVTWSSFGQDGSAWGIYGQRYDAAGNAIGNEFRVNSFTADWQIYSAVAALEGGGFVVTWQSLAQDGSSYGIYGQRYDAAGNAVGGESYLQAATLGSQTFPKVVELADGTLAVAFHDSLAGLVVSLDGTALTVGGEPSDYAASAALTTTGFSKTLGEGFAHKPIAALADGGFVVTWSSYNQDASSSWGVYGQRYDAAGNALGAEFRANTFTSFDQHYSSVAALEGGGFVVTWSSLGQDGDRYGIYGQRYDAAGNPVGAEFRANTFTSSEQILSSVAALDGGGFVVTWSSYAQDSGGSGIYGQRYDAAGNAVGAEFRANTFTGDTQAYASIAALEGGGFVVTWSSLWQDGNGWGIYGQRYDAGGNALGAEFRANSFTSSSQEYSSVAALEGGGFVVTWSSLWQDGSGYGIFGQRYNAAGNAVGPEFRANTVTSGDQHYSSVAALEGGGFVVTWSSLWQDGSGYGIYGQRYDAAGNTVGPEFRLSQAAAGDQIFPAFVQLTNGDLALTYRDNGQIATRVLTEVEFAFGTKDIAGTPANDVLLGATADDTLAGAAGNDSLDGGAGDDSLTDGPGADTLTGGPDADIFAFNAPGDLDDRVTDFTPGEDTLDLTALHGAALVFDASGGAMLSQATSVSFYQDGGDTIVIADLDGDPATAEFRVTLAGTHALTAADFIL